MAGHRGAPKLKSNAHHHLTDRQEQRRRRRRQVPWVRGRPEFARHPVRHFAFHLLCRICLYASPL